MRTPQSLLALSLSLITGFIGTSGAQNLASSRTLFDQGKWQEAATMAANLNTSESLAAAAEYTTAGAGLMNGGEKKATFEKAQEYARKAIALDSKNGEAYFELARAQGRLAQFAGILDSLGIAKDMKRNLDTAISLNPRIAGAYVALGLWHANLSAKGFIATSATGANRGQVVPNFQKAIALEPNNPTHRVEWVNALMVINVINQGNNKQFAISQLNKALSIPADTFWEKRVAAEARALLEKLK